MARTRTSEAVDGSGREAPLFASGERALQQTTDWSNERMVFASHATPKRFGTCGRCPTEGPLEPRRTRRCCISADRIRRARPECSLRMADGWRTPPISRDDGRCTLGLPGTWSERDANLDQRRGLPQWRRDGKELFYRSADQTLMAVTTSSTAGFSASAPVGCSRCPRIRGDRGMRASFRRRARRAALPGQRDARGCGTSPVSVFLNWPSTLQHTARTIHATDFKNPPAHRNPRTAASGWPSGAGHERRTRSVYWTTRCWH